MTPTPGKPIRPSRYRPVPATTTTPSSPPLPLPRWYYASTNDTFPCLSPPCPLVLEAYYHGRGHWECGPNHGLWKELMAYRRN